MASLTNTFPAYSEETSALVEMAASVKAKNLPRTWFPQRLENKHLAHEDSEFTIHQAPAGFVRAFEYRGYPFPVLL
ncbi:hypothetical protein BHYA_0023g00660 [Botrytis hyacinthi]|uniref:Uncharacterized protein n=1 Tax=Botrytis hyacinthi TaxID=278943 RepID=A0A4Z1GWU4_9HELO|nr:hypothetical protein BHYA_0023g00660 [Botrytis hyacinthi]